MTTTEQVQQGARQHAQERESRLANQGWIEVSFDGCPRRLVGKRCLNDREYGDCWCLNQLNDHSATYADKNARFILWEPYDAEGADLADVIAQAAAIGIDVIITASVWNPPWTVGIRFDKAAR